MRRSLNVGLMLLVGAATIAGAQTPPPPSATATTPPAKVLKPKKSCRRENTTGSIMPTSICHTAAEWATIDAQNQASANAMRDPHGRSGGFNQP